MGKVAELIRKFRTARSVSQFDLESTTGLGLGSISKIELGKISPNNEILFRIIKALGLTTAEALALYEINPESDDRFAKSISLIQAQKSFNDTLQACVNQISKELDIIGSAVYTVEGPQLVFRTLGENWFSKKMVAIADHYNNGIKYEIAEESDNAIVKSLVAKKLATQSSMYECTRPQMQRAVSDLIQNITGINLIAVLPIILGNNKTAGAYTIALNKNQSLEDNLPLFYLLTHLTGPLIAKWLRD